MRDVHARVLIVADDPATGSALRDALPADWDALSAAGRHQALASIDARTDALLIALRSEAEACDLAVAARSGRPGLVILVLAVGPGFAGLERARAARVDGVLPYPLALPEVPIAIEAHLEVSRERKGSRP